MKLYFSPGACSLASHIILNEAGLSFEKEKVDLGNKSPEFQRANPKGYVPVLQTERGETLTENAVILQYLADQKPETSLIPANGTWERYRALETLNFIATELHKGFGPLWALDRLVANKEGAEQLRASTVANLSRRFNLLNERLQNQPFLLGDRFTVCDAYLFTVLGWSRFHNIDMTPWPALMGYMERIQSRPAVRATMIAEGLMK